MSVNHGVRVTHNETVIPGPATQPLPAQALQLIADVAAQSPLVGQWLAGWLAARDAAPAVKVRLVVDAAHIEAADDA